MKKELNDLGPRLFKRKYHQDYNFLTPYNFWRNSHLKLEGTEIQARLRLDLKDRRSALGAFHHTYYIPYNFLEEVVAGANVVNWSNKILSMKKSQDGLGETASVEVALELIGYDGYGVRIVETGSYNYQKDDSDVKKYFTMNPTVKEKNTEKQIDRLIQFRRKNYLNIALADAFVKAFLKVFPAFKNINPLKPTIVFAFAPDSQILFEKFPQLSYAHDTGMMKIVINSKRRNKRLAKSLSV